MAAKSTTKSKTETEAPEDPQLAQVEAQAKADEAAREAAEGTEKVETVLEGEEAVAQVPQEPVTTSAAPPAGSGTEESEDAEETQSLPRSASNSKFHVTLDENPYGVPLVSVLPVGWVGQAPLQLAEDDLESLLDGLTKIKRSKK